MTHHHLGALIVAADLAAERLRGRVDWARAFGQHTESVAVDELEAIAYTTEQLLGVARELHAASFAAAVRAANGQAST